jgi:cytochrome b pre-mRNA-processing protein 3
VSILSRIFKGRNDRDSYGPLYDRAVAIGRDRSWYREGKVPDTLDGRFDMIAAVLALVLLRLEREGREGAEASVLVAELFIADLMVGKHVGKMMGALGGRLSAFRDEIAAGTGFEAAVRRNVFHDSPPSQAEVDFVSGQLTQLHRTLGRTPLASLLAGEIPTP